MSKRPKQRPARSTAVQPVRKPRGTPVPTPAPVEPAVEQTWVTVRDAVGFLQRRYHVTRRTAENQLYEGQRYDPNNFPARFVKKGGRRQQMEVDLKGLVVWKAKRKDELKHSRGAQLLPMTSQNPSVKPGVDNAADVLDPNELHYIETLADPDATPVEKGRATYHLSTLRLSKMAREGAISGTMLAEISRSLQELRRSEEGYMVIEEKRGQLVPLDLCQEMIGELVRRLNDAGNKLVGLLSTEIDVWMSSDMTSTERKRTIRAWLLRQLGELRTLEAKTVVDMTQTIMDRVIQRHEEMKGKVSQ